MGCACQIRARSVTQQEYAGLAQEPLNMATKLLGPAWWRLVAIQSERAAQQPEHPAARSSSGANQPISIRCVRSANTPNSDNRAPQ